MVLRRKNCIVTTPYDRRLQQGIMKGSFTTFRNWVKLARKRALITMPTTFQRTILEYRGTFIESKLDENSYTSM